MKLPTYVLLGVQNGPLESLKMRLVIRRFSQGSLGSLGKVHLEFIQSSAPAMG
jgi:hypothetical protein